MLKIIFFFLLLILPLNKLKSQISSNWNKDSSYYLYQIVDDKLSPQRMNINQNLTREEILDSIANYLTEVFFVPSNKYYKDKRKIEITVQEVTSIRLHNQTFYLATINIIDPDEVCMTTFFQGSTGGYNTYLTLVSNFIQPQRSTPLLNGIIFTYNGDELKVMDHINLQGIISEREINDLVRKSIKY